MISNYYIFFFSKQFIKDKISNLYVRQQKAQEWFEAMIVESNVIVNEIHVLIFFTKCIQKEKIFPNKSMIFQFNSFSGCFDQFVKDRSEAFLLFSREVLETRPPGCINYFDIHASCGSD